METKLSKGERTRQKLIQNAIVYLNKYGTHQVKIDDLMRSLGLTSGVFYANFSSKEELLQTALEAQVSSLKRALFFSATGETGDQWLKTFIEFYLSPSHRDFMGLICPIPTIYLQQHSDVLSVQMILVRYRNQLEGLLAKRLQDCQIEDSWKASTLLSVCIGTLQLARAESDSVKSHQILTSTKEMIFSQINIRNH